MNTRTKVLSLIARTGTAARQRGLNWTTIPNRIALLSTALEHTEAFCAELDDAELIGSMVKVIPAGPASGTVANLQIAVADLDHQQAQTLGAGITAALERLTGGLLTVAQTASAAAGGTGFDPGNEPWGAWRWTEPRAFRDGTLRVVAGHAGLDAISRSGSRLDKIVSDLTLSPLSSRSLGNGPSFIETRIAGILASTGGDVLHSLSPPTGRRRGLEMLACFGDQASLDRAIELLNRLYLRFRDEVDGLLILPEDMGPRNATVG